MHDEPEHLLMAQELMLMIAGFREFEHLQEELAPYLWIEEVAAEIEGGRSFVVVDPDGNEVDRFDFGCVESSR